MKKQHARWIDLLAMAVVAVGLRAAVFGIVAWVDGVGFDEYAVYRDGDHYIAYARAWAGDFSEFQPQYRRLFPGWPAVMALMGAVGVPLTVAGMASVWLLGGAVAAGSAIVFEDRRIGWAMAVLTPTALLNASMISTETPMLVLALAAVWLGRRGRDVGAGGLLGLAGLMRPVACFAALGYLAMRSAVRRWRGGIVAGLLAAVVVAAGMGLVRWRFGDAMMAAHGYSEAFDGQIVTWPGESLIMTPLRQPTAMWKIIYVWLHVAIVLIGCVLAGLRWSRRVREYRREERDADSGFDRVQLSLAAMASIWLWGNTAFVLCVGDQWGFHEFHRFIIPALPPLFWAYQMILPRWTGWWLMIAVPSLAMAVAAASQSAL